MVKLPEKNIHFPGNNYQLPFQNVLTIPGYSSKYSDNSIPGPARSHLWKKLPGKYGKFWKTVLYQFLTFLEEFDIYGKKWSRCVSVWGWVLVVNFSKHVKIW